MLLILAPLNPRHGIGIVLDLFLNLILRVCGK